MKKHVQLFEEFLTDPAQEAALLKQFTTSAATAMAMGSKTHSVSQIVSDEHGIHTVIGDQTQVAAAPAVIAPEGTN